MEYKTALTEFKAEGDQGEYEGHFSVFNNVDDGNDVAHPGMFLKTIAERGKRVKVFYAHDWNKLIGPPPSVLEEDAVGLHAKGRLTLEAFWGKEAWALMKDGALSEGSFGYETVKADFDNSGVRHLREVRLFEISPVPLGMNSLTDLQAIKSLLTADTTNTEQQLEILEAAARTIRPMTKAGRVLSAANVTRAKTALASLQEAIDALTELLAAAEPEPEKLHSALRARARAAQAALALYPH